MLRSFKGLSFDLSKIGAYLWQNQKSRKVYQGTSGRIFSAGITSVQSAREEVEDAFSVLFDLVVRLARLQMNSGLVDQAFDRIFGLVATQGRDDEVVQYVAPVLDQIEVVLGDCLVKRVHEQLFEVVEVVGPCIDEQHFNKRGFCF